MTYEPSLSFGVPRPVFEEGVGPDQEALLDIVPSNDDDRFIGVLRDPESVSDASVSIVENWFEDFRDRR